MKLKHLMTGAALSLLLLASCDGGNVTGKSIKEAGATTTNDSISYYEGMAMAQMYQQMAMSDTTLKGDQGKADFMKGFAAGLKALEGKSDGEAAGIIAGIQAAMQNKDLTKTFDIQFNNNLIRTGLAYALSADSLAQSSEGPQYLNKTMQRLSAKKGEENRKAALQSMSGLAKQGFKQVQPGIYAKTVKPGTGAQLKDGDNVTGKVVMKNSKNQPIDKLPMPEKFIVGQTFGMGSPLNTGLQSMKVGETAIFAIPAEEMFNGQQKQLGLNDTDYVLIEITASEVTGNTAAKTNAANVQAQPAAKAAAPAKAAPAK